MSAEPLPETASPAVARLAERVEALAEQNGELSDRVESLEDENQMLRGRVDELEAQPRIQWDSDKPSDMRVKHPDEETADYPLGASVKSKASADRVWDSVDELSADVETLKYEGVDVTDLAGGQPLNAALLIEDRVQKYNAGTPLRDELSGNEKRAAVLFKAFGSRSKTSMNGRTLRIDSADVRSILADPDTGLGQKDLNSNTVKQAMAMFAKLSVKKPQEERDAYDDDNLFTLGKHDGRLAIRASKQEYNEFIADLENRYEQAGVTQ